MAIKMKWLKGHFKNFAFILSHLEIVQKIKSMT